MKNLLMKKVYTRPEVLSHQLVHFETCHSWNKGQGTCPDVSDGNHGIHYPNPPFTGTHHGNDGTNGGGNGKGHGQGGGYGNNP